MYLILNWFETVNNEKASLNVFFFTSFDTERNWQKFQDLESNIQTFVWEQLLNALKAWLHSEIKVT